MFFLFTHLVFLILVFYYLFTQDPIVIFHLFELFVFFVKVRLRRIFRFFKFHLEKQVFSQSFLQLDNLLFQILYQLILFVHLQQSLSELAIQLFYEKNRGIQLVVFLFRNLYQFLYFTLNLLIVYLIQSDTLILSQICLFLNIFFFLFLGKAFKVI